MQPRRSIPLTAGVALLLALPASAGVFATFDGLTLEGTYQPGVDITVTVFGDSEGRESALISLILTVDPALILVESSVGTLADSHPDRSWEQSAVAGTCGQGSDPPNRCLALDAFELGSAGQDPLDLLLSTLSVFRFDTSNTVGQPITFSIDPYTYTNGDHTFFELPGASYTFFTPEPASGLLLGLGLTALAAARVRRRRGAPHA